MPPEMSPIYRPFINISCRMHHYFLPATIPVKAKIWMMGVPTFSQVLLIGKLMRDEGIRPVETLVSISSTAAVAALLFVLTARLYDRDKLVLAANRFPSGEQDTMFGVCAVGRARREPG